MDDTITEDSNVATPLSTTKIRQTKIITSECNICGDSARYSYYGTIACQSCKVFFRRNAVSRRGVLKCHFNNPCDINVNNRHTCSACRLKKCFANGMCTEMIRCSRTRPPPDLVTTTSTTSVPLRDQNQPEQIPISNLLQSDQSTLSIDQWNLLSNLVHCYDEYSGCSFVQRYIHDQNSLPVKLRFKCSSVRDFFTEIKSKIQQGIEKNRDCLSLSLHDRRILLRATVQYTSSIGSMFTLRQYQLLDYESFYESAETIFRPSAAAFTRRAINQLDSDDTFIKLMLATFAFSTTKYTIYTKNILMNQTNIKAIVAIQDTYTEITWRYLLYKCNHREAVIRFSNLIRSLLFVIAAIVEANESQQFIEMVDTVIERTEQTLCFQLKD